MTAYDKFLDFLKNSNLSDSDKILAEDLLNKAYSEADENGFIEGTKDCY